MRGYEGYEGYEGYAGLRGYEGYEGLRGYEGYAGYAGYAGRTTSPKSGRGVCRFLDRPPPIHEGRKKEQQTISQPKRNAYFQFKLLIINDINQYFNIHLHLISFIIYNR